MKYLMISVLLSVTLTACQQIPTTPNQLSRMEHPSNQWTNRCDSPSYAQCGYDSLKNRQNGGSQAP